MCIENNNGICEITGKACDTPQHKEALLIIQAKISDTKKRLKQRKSLEIFPVWFLSILSPVLGIIDAGKAINEIFSGKTPSPAFSLNTTLGTTKNDLDKLKEQLGKINTGGWEKGFGLPESQRS